MLLLGFALSGSFGAGLRRPRITAALAAKLPAIARPSPKFDHVPHEPLISSLRDQRKPAFGGSTKHGTCRGIENDLSVLRLFFAGDPSDSPFGRDRRSEWGGCRRPTYSAQYKAP